MTGAAFLVTLFLDALWCRLTRAAWRNLIERPGLLIARRIDPETAHVMSLRVLRRTAWMLRTPLAVRVARGDFLP